MRYLCSGSLSTFRCAIPSIPRIGGYGSPMRVVCARAHTYSWVLGILFLQGRASVEKRGGGPES
jgi:hypothetical protein